MWHLTGAPRQRQSRASDIAEAIFGDFAPSGKLPYTIYPNVWAANTPMEDMSLTAGQGRTYRFYGYNDKSLSAHFEFGDTVNE